MDWASPTKVAKELGVPKSRIMKLIHNGGLPHDKNGTRYLVNVKLVRAWLFRQDIANMEYVKKQIELIVFVKRKTSHYTN